MYFSLNTVFLSITIIEALLAVLCTTVKHDGVVVVIPQQEELPLQRSVRVSAHIRVVVAAHGLESAQRVCTVVRAGWRQGCLHAHVLKSPVPVEVSTHDDVIMISITNQMRYVAAGDSSPGPQDRVYLLVLH